MCFAYVAACSLFCAAAKIGPGQHRRWGTKNCRNAQPARKGTRCPRQISAEDCRKFEWISPILRDSHACAACPRKIALNLSLWTSAFELLVRFCCRHAGPVVVASILAAVGASFYVSQRFEMDSNAENLISAEVSWRQNQAEFDKAFPQRNNLTVVVIDGATPERTRQTAAALEKALAANPRQFPVVRDIQGDAFFAKNGLLFLPLEDVRKTAQQIIAAQPLRAPLAADPSVRGIMESLSTALLGIENGQASIEQLSPALTALSETRGKTT